MYMPPIAPTGAMASGAYTEYMISYLSAAIEDVSDGADAYLGSSTLEGWDAQWDRTVRDLTTKVTDLTTAVSKLKSQVIMAQDAINKL